MNERSALASQVKNLIISRLKLEGIGPDDIGDDAPLFGEGLGLDSIDALELVLAVEQKFGVRIEDEEVGRKALGSVSALCGFLEERGVAA
jgi:acyl carrier protein